jgi:hypothetical protein
LSTSDLVSAGVCFPSSVPDSNSDRLILDTRPPVSNTSFEKISINLGLSASQLETLFLDVDNPDTDGTNWVNYDLRSLQQQLAVNSFSDTSLSLHFDLSDSSPVIIIDSGDISTAQGLVQLDNDDIDSISAKSGTAFLVINFDSSNDSTSVGVISTETDTQPIVIDFFSFGLKENQEVNNAIYRFELEETSSNSSTFSGTMEYAVTSQLNFFSSTLIKTLKTISDEVKFLVNDRLIDEEGIAISYSDIAAVGTTIDVSEKKDILTNSGTVGISSTYRIGHPVVITLYDPDLNVKHDTIESYSVNNNPNSENVDTVGSSDGQILLEVLIKGERFKRCTIDGIDYGGLGSTSFTLTETGKNTGTFGGIFRMPSRICNEDGTETISIKGGSVEVKYYDLRDSFGKPNIFSTTQSSTTQANPPTLSADQFPLPKSGETKEVVLSGKVGNYKEGTSIKVTIIDPDNITNEHSLFATKDGSYKGIFTLNSKSKYGKYDISISYLGVLQGKASFNVTRHIVPDWIKNNADWWSKGQITDDDFIKGIEHLIKEEIISIPSAQTSPKSEKTIPSWIKNTANWWSEDLITDEEFVSALEFLVKVGIIKV